MSFLPTQCSVSVTCLSVDGISTNPEKVEKVQNWPVPSNQKEFHSFLDLAFYYRCFIPKFAAISKCLHELPGPTHVKRGNLGQRQPEIVIFNGQMNTRRHPVF